MPPKGKVNDPEATVGPEQQKLQQESNRLKKKAIDTGVRAIQHRKMMICPRPFMLTPYQNDLPWLHLSSAVVPHDARSSSAMSW